MAGFEGFDTDSESVAEPGETSFESFDLRLHQFEYDCESSNKEK